jgi:hypothetical protein
MRRITKEIEFKYPTHKGWGLLNLLSKSPRSIRLLEEPFQNSL